MNRKLPGIGFLFVMLLALPVTVAAEGNISISAEPAGTEIWLNGTSTGLYTDSVIESVPAGTHNVTLVHPGWVPYVLPSVSVMDNATTTLSATMTNLTSSVSFESVPSGARVYLDNIYIGYSNISAYTAGYGNHTVLMELDGYDDQTHLVTVANTTETFIVEFSSSTVNGSIYFTSSPSYAMVYVDGEYAGTTPLTVSDLTPGSYSVLFYKYNYLNWSDTVVVTAGTETDEDATLEYAGSTPTTTTVATTITTATPVPETYAAAVVTTAPATVAPTRVKSVSTVPTPWPTSEAEESPAGHELGMVAAAVAAILFLKRA